jgi:hypothetical protein
MRFNGKLGVQQRVLPSYRVPFFDLLAGHCTGGMSLFAGQARPVEMIAGGTTRLPVMSRRGIFILLAARFIFAIKRISSSGSKIGIPMR